MRKAFFCNLLLALGIFLAGALPAAAAPKYTCLDLNKVPGMKVSSIHPRGVSEAGEVVGYAGLVSAGSPFLEGSGGIVNVGFSFPGFPNFKLIPFYVPPFTFPDPNDPYWVYGSCRRKRWWVGLWQDSSPPYNSHAFLYNGDNGGGSGTVWDLGTLGGTGSRANGVNDAGQVVGVSYTSSGSGHAFLYSGVIQDILPGVSSSEARGINNAGQVVGVAGAYAFLWSSGGGLQDLGTLKAPYDAGSDAHAINEAGQVVGNSSAISGDSHAFLYDGTMHDLGTLPGGLICTALGINNAGQVVGYSAADSARAFLYSGGVMYDLNSLVQNLPAGVVLTAAYGINDQGQIIADGGIGGYSNHGYVLTPIRPVSALQLLLE